MPNGQTDLFAPDDESWAPVPEYPDFQVSTYGRVWRKAREQNFYSAEWGRYVRKEYPAGYVALNDQGCGYLQVRLKNYEGTARKLVHRLVIRVHGPEPPTDEHTQVNHIDRDRKNNHIDNLEWTTRSENRLHAHLRSYVDEHSMEKLRNKIDDWT